MAFADTTWYVNAGDQSTTGYYALTKRVTAAATAVAAGVIRRQFTAPAVGSERAFICIIAGTTANAVDATWVLTRGAKTVDGTVTWMECTGAAAMNGDATNTPNWTTVKNTAITQGQIIKRVSGTSYQICTTAGTAGNAAEPAFSDTAGVTTADGTATWTSLGVVGNFTAGLVPHARLGNALASTWAANGNTVYVASASAESQASSISYTTGTSLLLLIYVLCHNSGAFPPLSANLTTGATVTATGASTVTLSGCNYYRGITFISGSGASNGGIVISPLNSGNALGSGVFESCSLQLGGTGAGGVIQVGTTGAANCYVEFRNTKVKFGATGQHFTWQDTAWKWKNTNAASILETGSSIPTILASPPGGGIGMIAVWEGLDLSGLTGTLVSPAVQISTGMIVIKDCKLNASATISTTPIGHSGLGVALIRCSDTTNYRRSEQYHYCATETTETAITRVGGATDPNGDAQTRKIVTNGNSLWVNPYPMETLAIWNTVTAANVTVTVEGTINSATLPNNDEIWIEVEYFGSAASPLGSFVSGSKADFLAAAAALTASGSTWNGGGSGAGWSPFKMAVTLSSPQPQKGGYIFVRVYAAKINTTYYVDPKVVLS